MHVCRFALYNTFVLVPMAMSRALAHRPLALDDDDDEDEVSVLRGVQPKPLILVDSGTESAPSLGLAAGFNMSMMFACECTWVTVTWMPQHVLLCGFPLRFPTPCWPDQSVAEHAWLIITLPVFW
jgi:hypothetical protein